MKLHPATVIVSFFGVGYLPISGTMGSAAALIPAWFIHHAFGNMALLAAAVLAFAVGWIATKRHLDFTDNKDPKEVVIDEVAAQWLLLSAMFPTTTSYIIGFFVFRVFDVWKPWPVSYADQKVPGALGVMLDDIWAAAYPILIFLLLAAIDNHFHLGWGVTDVLKFLSREYVL